MTDAPPLADAADTGTGSHGPSDPPGLPPRTPLRRNRDQKVIAGVCGGLGRYFDLDPVIFRVVLSVLAVTGGLGLIVYGFCWLLVPLRGESEHEGRKLLSGRVEGSSLTAVLCALVGCGLFLSMLNNGGVMTFALMLTLAVVGATYWSHHRRQMENEGEVDAATAQTVADAPPEAQAPPARDTPSWWRDPIVKDGTTGHVGAASGYLWGPDDGTEYDTRPGGGSGPWSGPWSGGGRGSTRTRGPVERGGGIAGWVFLVAALAGFGVTRAMWSTHPLGTSLEAGLATALGVQGLGIVISSRYGRTGGGTLTLALLVSVALAGAVLLPKSVTADWSTRTWAPTSAGAVRAHYELGAGVGNLRLGSVPPAKGDTLSTHAEVGAGRLRVTIPRNVTARLDIEVGLGDIRLPGDPKDDIDVSPERHRTVTLRPEGKPKAAGGTLKLDLEVGIGQVEVVRR